MVLFVLLKHYLLCDWEKDQGVKKKKKKRLKEEANTSIDVTL